MGMCGGDIAASMAKPVEPSAEDREKATHLQNMTLLPAEWRYERTDLDKAIAVMCALGVMGACAKEDRGSDKCGHRCYRVRALAKAFYQVRVAARQEGDRAGYERGKKEGAPRIVNENTTLDYFTITNEPDPGCEFKILDGKKHGI